VIAEIEVLRHLDDVMLLLWVLDIEIGMMERDYNKGEYVPIGGDYRES